MFPCRCVGWSINWQIKNIHSQNWLDMVPDKIEQLISEVEVTHNNYGKTNKVREMITATVEKGDGRLWSSI